MKEKDNTSLVFGNFLMQSGDYEAAMRHYLDVLERTPELGKSICANLLLAKKRYRSNRKKISRPLIGVCSWELAHNCAGRAYALASIYQRFAEVEIIGTILPQFGREIWEPIRGTSIAKHSILVEDESCFLNQAIELVGAHPYDIVHLSKPRAPNILIGILYKLIWGSKVFVDVDDEELAFVDADKSISIDAYLAQYGRIPDFINLAGKDWTRLSVGLITAFDGITVSNPGLQKRYGGDVVRHARDEMLYMPSVEQKKKSREKYEIPPDKKVILFLGTPREHKGLVEAAEAIAATKRKDILFVIAGEFPDQSLKEKLRKNTACDFRFLGNQSFENVPQVTAIADCCILLQSADPEAIYQVPAKLSDALAMGVPAICSITPGTADLHCDGLIFVDDKRQLAEAINRCLNLNGPDLQGISSGLRDFFEKNLSITSQLPTLQKLCTKDEPAKAISSDGRKLANALQSHSFLGILADIEVKMRQGNTPLSSCTFSAFNGSQRDASRTRHEIYAEKTDLGIIILNLNGASLLDRLFESIYQNKPNLSYRIFVTDHCSLDESKDVIERWAKILPIEAEYAEKNYTFSFSNNRWAEHLVGFSKLLFLNNDIVFKSNVLDKMARVLDDPAIGVVGIDQWEPIGKDGDRQWHHCGIGFKWDAQYRFWRPFNMRMPDSKKQSQVRAVPAVTGSVMMVRRSDFLGIEGFDEGYNYGYEDVDLCLGFMRKLRKKSVCIASDDVIHADGVTRKKTPRDELKQQRLGNIELLRKKFTGQITRLYRQQLLGEQPLAQEIPRIVFAVTEVGKAASAGDLFTAMELGQAFESEFGWKVEYRPRGEQWYTLAGVDIVIAMVDAYDPRRIQGAHPGLVKVAWARNWFERWCDRDWHDEYDLYLASSQRSADYIADRIGQPPRVLKIGTNPQRFDASRRNINTNYDFVFTGSYWNVERDIVSALEKLPGTVTGAIYGKNWEKVPQLTSLSKGFLPYDQLPEVYCNSKIVIDDANHVTKPWGSVNSRVFDALAAGCLVVTNSELASGDAFDGELPVYETPEHLAELLTKFSTDEAGRESLVRKLRNRVLGEHTYTHRAYEFREYLRDHTSKALRFGVKIPVPKRELAPEWGDYHFAKSLAREFRALGNSVRIDFLPDWERGDHEGDDVTLVLRGLSEYKIKHGSHNFIWLISHPDKVGDEELNSYDHVFVASSYYAEKLSKRLRVPVSALLQCTDDRKFNARALASSDAPYTDILFVGNSRNQFRKIIRDALSVGLSPNIYGTRWENFVPGEAVKGLNVPNDELPGYYAKADVVLNDHWDDMAENGFLSNRLFDAVACGATVISDHCEGIDKIFGDSVKVYKSASELADLVRHAQADQNWHVKARLSAKIIDENNFRVRARKIMSILNFA